MQALHDVVQAGYVRYIGMSSCWAYQCRLASRRVGSATDLITQSRRCKVFLLCKSRGLDADLQHRLCHYKPLDAFYFHAEPPQSDLSRGGTGNVPDFEGGERTIECWRPHRSSCLIDVWRWMYSMVSARERVAYSSSWRANNPRKDGSVRTILVTLCASERPIGPSTLTFSTSPTRILLTGARHCLLPSQRCLTPQAASRRLPRRKALAWPKLHLLGR